MDDALFLLPTIRRVGKQYRVQSDPTVGALPPWPGALGKKSAAQRCR